MVKGGTGERGKGRENNGEKIVTNKEEEKKGKGKGEAGDGEKRQR